MTFQEAKKLIEQGKKVFRHGWEEKIRYIWRDGKDGPLKLERYDGKIQYFAFSKEDRITEDWGLYNAG